MTGSFPFHILQTHTHTHKHIHRAVGDYRMASCIGSMPMYLIWSKHFVAVCVCVCGFGSLFYCRFSFFFFFSIRKSAYQMAICVSHTFKAFYSPFSLSYSFHLSFPCPSTAYFTITCAPWKIAQNFH